MKHIIYIYSVLILTGCRQNNTEQKSRVGIETKTEQVFDTTNSKNNQTVKQTSKEEKENEEYRKQSLSEFKKITLYKLSDTIKDDFNGDGIIDKAFYKEENQNSGIIIKHGRTNELVKIGFGKQFAHMTEFDWVDYWALVKDRKTTKTTFTDNGDVLASKEVKLQNPSIALSGDETAGGIITFINGKYVWIHQAD